MELKQGLILPERVPIVTPASGVKPIDAPQILPPSIAAIDCTVTNMTRNSE